MAGLMREALDYAKRYLTACRGTENEKRAAKRVAFLTQRYPESGSASAPPVAGPPVITTPAQNATSGATAATTHRIGQTNSASDPSILLSVNAARKL